MDSTSGLRGAAAATVALTVAAGLGQIFTVGRDLILAARVGLSPGLDSLLIAAAIPSAVAGVFVGGLQTALISTMTEAQTRAGAIRGARIASSVLIATAIGGTLLVGVLVALATPIASVVGAALTDSGREEMSHYLVWLSPMLLFISVDAVVSAAQRAGGQFSQLAFGWVAGPLVAFAASVMLWEPAGLTGYAIALTAGSAATASAQVIVFARGPGIQRPVIPSREELLRLAGHALPLSGGFAVAQLSPVVERFIASFIGTGAVSALRYSDLIVKSATYAAGTAWTTVAYPTLARLGRSANARLGHATETAVRTALVAFVPMSVGLSALAPLLVDLAYGRGTIDSGDARVISLAVICASPTVILYAIQPVLFGAHNVRRNAAFLGWLAVGNLGISTVLRIVLGSVAGVPGIAAAMPLATAITVIAMAVSLAKVEDEFSLRRIGTTLGRSLALAVSVGAPVAAVAWLIRGTVPLAVNILVMSVSILVASAFYLYAVRRRLVITS